MEICITNLYADRHTWVELPIEEDDFLEELQSIGVSTKIWKTEYWKDDTSWKTNGKGEWLISDVGSDMDVQVHHFENMTIDDICNGKASEWGECENDYHDVAVAISEAYGMEDVDIRNCRTATLFEGIEDEEELGEYVVDYDYFSYEIPAGLEDFLDYEKIGDWFEDEGNFTSTGFLLNL